MNSHNPFFDPRQGHIDPAPKAWFLGPKAENQEYFERMLLEAFRDYCYWRRNFHPEDLGYIRSQDRLQPEFLQYQESLHDHLFEMLSQLKKSMPFFSPRYLGHMCKDLLVPGTLGYIAAMFYNQNNITQEAATITTRFEAEALQTIARMLGYRVDQAWGHLCSGGTVANMEALWVARNLRLFPWQLALMRQWAQRELKTQLDTLLAENGCEFCWTNPVALSVQRSLELYSALQAQVQTLAAQDPALSQELSQLLQATSVVQLGLLGFYQACQRELQGAPQRLRLAYSQNAHYSLRKSLGLLGLGEAAALTVPLDAHLRLDVAALRERLWALPEDELVLAVVGVYGSTEEGAIDDFDQLLALRQEWEAQGRGSFWLHGDACYGGYALSLLEREESHEMEPAAALQAFLQEVAHDQLQARAQTEEKGFWAWRLARCQRWLQVSEALAGCDSISLDPHKLGYLPYPAGSVVYRDYRVREFIRCDAPYINAKEREAEAEQYWNTPYPGKYTLEGSRPGATSAAVWLAHQTVPLNRQGHGRLVAGTLLGASYLQQVLQAEIAARVPGLHCRFLVAESDLNILCYTFTGHFQGQSLSLAQSNALVAELYQLLLEREVLPLATQDFIVSMTRLEAAVYGQERLSVYWQGLLNPDSEAVADDQHLALIRTVIMDPFLLEAQTRPNPQNQPQIHSATGPQALARIFARTLAHLVQELLQRAFSDQKSRA